MLPKICALVLHLFSLDWGPGWIFWVNTAHTTVPYTISLWGSTHPLLKNSCCISRHVCTRSWSVQSRRGGTWSLTWTSQSRGSEKCVWSHRYSTMSGRPGLSTRVTDASRQGAEPGWFQKQWHGRQRDGSLWARNSMQSPRWSSGISHPPQGWGAVQGEIRQQC